MPWSTASQRLKKNIMFSFVVKLGLDNCYRCGKKIDNALDLSIEHKIEWARNSVELFWNLDNIAFSHRKCNLSRAHRNNIRNAPEGKAWCSGCADFTDTHNFNKNKSAWNGLSYYCKSCMRSKYGSKKKV